MIDINSIPKINIVDLSLGNARVLVENGVATLFVDDQIWMEEDLDGLGSSIEMYPLYDLAYGDVLLSGFGFGILAEWISQKENVRSVTVVEKSQEVVDIYMMNNALNDKVKIIIDDMSNFVTENYYDCILLDHYQFEDNEYKIKDIQNISKNVPNHSLIYSWAIELIYLEKIFNNRFELFLDQENRWNNFKDLLKIKTIPDLPVNKVRDYVCLATNRKTYKQIFNG